MNHARTSLVDVLLPGLLQRAREHAPLIVGLCGPQGSGKSTLAAALRSTLEERGVRAASLSLDDLYLTRAQRAELAQRIHPLLLTRGVPGTHDVELGLQTIDSLRRTGLVALPSFDKAIDDRRRPADWPRIHAPVDIVLFEGWCVGAVPQTDERLQMPLNDLEREEDADGRWRRYVNDALACTYRTLFAQIDYLVLLTTVSFEHVYAWRAQQEHELRRQLEEAGRSTKDVMSDAQLRRFIAHYERLTRHILEEMPARADLVVELAADRRITAIRAAPS